MSSENDPGKSVAAPWYAGVTRYQWLILIIASLGWIFDVYEGQLFNITRDKLVADVLGQSSLAHDELVRLLKYYKDILLIPFLLGGAVGGLFFGTMADRWGRKPTMAGAILTYSLFSGLTFFAQKIWHVAALRFLVAVGIGGEWAVAASLVAEVFPATARARASGIFHASSVLGTWLATLASLIVGLQWRYAYLMGVIPALLVVWVMASVNEPESWKKTVVTAKKGDAFGSLKELLSDPRWRARAILGMLLAAVGLGTYWAVHISGQDLAKSILLKSGVAPEIAQKKAESAYGFIQTIGGGLGLLSFGPICARLGRKRTFVIMHIAGFIIVPITCYLPQTYGQLLCLLPIFGFLTLSMHAGYAIYFPELFPTHLRATGAGFCFNVGRALAASMLFFSGWLKTRMDLRQALSLLGCLFLLGLVVIHFLPETKDQPLPE